MQVCDLHADWCGRDPTVCNMRDWIMKKIEIDTAEGRLLSSRHWRNLCSAYSRHFRSMLHQPHGEAGAECARDARTMYRLPVHGDYCSQGVNAHTVFFPLMGQYAPQVAGWGGDAGKDALGRPVVLVMGITVPLTATERYNYDHRAIILHELVHGLGFGIWNFQNSYDSTGALRQIVSYEQVIDVDGAMMKYGLLSVHVRCP